MRHSRERSSRRSVSQHSRAREAGKGRRERWGLASSVLDVLLNGVDVGGQFELTEPEELLKLFVTMARNQVLDESRYYKAARRVHRRQVADLSEHCLGGFTDDSPEPSRIVSARELLEEITRRLSTEERDLLEQRAAGQEWTTLAEQRGTSAAALRKKLSRAITRVISEIGLLDPHQV
jgi:RNA polymerase sigma-70 factor (ECF subfamily)